jgi:hypothetical protein
MRTDKQNQASRNNGAKSKGPVTPEGKAASSQNAGRHNLCTGPLVILTNEDPREFHRLMDDYMVRFQPIDGVELDLVHKIIAATWREKRVTAMETSLFELEMVRQQPDVDDEYESITAAARQTLALFGTDDTKTAAALLFRYGSTARRAFVSAFRLLRELQGDRFNRPSPSGRIPQHRRNRNHDDASPLPAHTQPESQPTAVSSSLRNAGLASFIVLRRHCLEHLPAAETPELRNEPEHALAACQSGHEFLVRV